MKKHLTQPQHIIHTSSESGSTAQKYVDTVQWTVPFIKCNTVIRKLTQKLQLNIKTTPFYDMITIMESKAKWKTYEASFKLKVIKLAKKSNNYSAVTASNKITENVVQEKNNEDVINE